MKEIKCHECGGVYRQTRDYPDLVYTCQGCGRKVCPYGEEIASVIETLRGWCRVGSIRCPCCEIDQAWWRPGKPAKTFSGESGRDDALGLTCSSCGFVFNLGTPPDCQSDAIHSWVDVEEWRIGNEPVEKRPGPYTFHECGGCGYQWTTGLHTSKE